MNEDFNNENFKLENEIDIRDLDEEAQNKLRAIIEKIGLQDKIDMEKVLKEEEYIEEIDLVTVITTDIDEKNSTKYLSLDSDNIFAIPQSKIVPADKDDINKILLGNEVKSSNKIEYIHVSQLVQMDSSINFFPKPDDEEFLNLSESIEMYGIINPILVVKNQLTGLYDVICGNNRVSVSMALYANSNDEKYLMIPCIELYTTDPSIIQGIVISTNLQYRKMPKEILIKSIHLLDDALSKNKKSKNEMNITDTIARRAGVSRSTVNNYRELKKLSPKAKKLVFEKHMNLQVAKQLATADHEVQDKIIEALGNNINDMPKVKALLEGPAEKIYDKEEDKSIKETWDKKIERTMRMIPHMTTFVVTVVSTSAEKCLRTLAGLKKEVAIDYMTQRKNSINQFFRVKMNDYHMEQYVRKGFASQYLVDKIKSVEFNDIINFS